MLSDIVRKVDFDEVIDRLKNELSVSSNRGLSELLGMSSAGISAGKRNDTLPYMPIVETCINNGIDLQYIFTGEYSKPTNSQSPAQAEDLFTKEDMIQASEIVDRVLDKVLIEKSVPEDRKFKVYKTLRPVLIDAAFEHGLNERYVYIIAKSALTLA